MLKETEESKGKVYPGKASETWPEKISREEEKQNWRRSFQAQGPQQHEQRCEGKEPA